MTTTNSQSMYKELELLPRILKVDQICECLSISQPKVYDLLRLKKEYGGLPSFRIGRSRRIDRDDLLEWLEMRKQENKNS